MALTFYNSIDEFIGVLRQLTIVELDGNIYTLHTRLKDLEELSGKQIATITSSGTSFIITYTDSTTDVIPFPQPSMPSYAGLWTNDTPYTALSIVTVGPGSAINQGAAGVYMAVISHVSPAAPELFDPEADDGSGNLLWVPLMPLADFAMDFAFARMGTLPSLDTSNDPGGLLIGQYVSTRSFSITNDPVLAEGFLGTPATSSSIVCSIEYNETAVGTVTFLVGQATATIELDDIIEGVRGDRIGLRLLSSDGLAADLSFTISGIRTDVFS